MVCYYCQELMCECLFCPVCGGLVQQRQPGEDAIYDYHGYCERCFKTGPAWGYGDYDEWLAEERKPEVCALRELQEQQQILADEDTTRFTDRAVRLREGRGAKTSKSGNELRPGGFVETPADYDNLIYQLQTYG